MRNQGVLHDVAFAATQHIIETVPERLVRRDKAKVFFDIYQRVKAALETYECWTRPDVPRPSNN